MNRGDVFRVRLPGREREQRGQRYGVIVQADEFLGLSTVLIAPTSRSAAAATFRPEVEVPAGRPGSWSSNSMPSTSSAWESRRDG